MTERHNPNVNEIVYNDPPFLGPDGQAPTDLLTATEAFADAWLQEEGK